MEFLLEQCKNISELLKRKNINEKTKKDIAILLLNTLSNIDCNRCKHNDKIHSFVYCTENKCNITQETCPDCLLIKGRIVNCPYKKYEDECKEILETDLQSKKIKKDYK